MSYSSFVFESRDGVATIRLLRLLMASPPELMLPRICASSRIELARHFSSLRSGCPEQIWAHYTCCRE